MANRLASALVLGCATGAIAIATATPAHAQESSSSLRGQITGGATEVTAVDPATSFRRSVSIDENGRYNFPQLRPATYYLEITTADGDVRQTDEFTLLIAQDALLNFDVNELAAVSGSPGAPSDDNLILVTGQRIRTLEGGEVGANITQREISTLPQNNRNFLAFAELAPGVSFENPDGQSRIQGGGQNSRTVNVYIDGVGQKDYVLKNGITGQDSSEGNPFPQLAVGEYRVISSNYKAEFDQVSSVAITAGTKSGTNEYHGSVFFDYQDSGMREKTIDEKVRGREKVEVRDMQFGGSLGGPIIADTLFFFGTYEGKRIIRPATVEPGASFPESFFPADLQDRFGPNSREFNENLYFGKLSFQPTSRDVFELTGKYRDETGVFSYGGTTSEEAAASQDVDEIRGLFRWEHTSDNFVNDFKATYENAFWSPRPQNFTPGRIYEYSGISPVTGQLLNRARLLRIGGSANFQDKGQEGYSIQNDFTWIGIPDHTIKAGIKSKWVRLDRVEQNFFNAQYSYNVNFPDGGFNTTVPYEVQFGAGTGQGTPSVISNNWQFGIYIQDDWIVNDRLTLNLGIRWDYEETPSYLDFVTPPEVVAAVSEANYPNIFQPGVEYDINDYITDGTQRDAFLGAFQPRLGFSYEFLDQGKLVLFGGYGRSYDRNQFDFIAQEVSINAYSTRTFNFITGDPENECNPSPTCVPFDPIYLTEEGRQQLLDNAGVGAGRSIRLINNDLKVPYSDQFSLGLRSDLTSLFNVEVGYRHIKSRDGFAYLLGNRRPDGSFFPDAPATPSSPFGFAPPGWGSIIIGTNGLRTDEDAFHFKFVKRYSQRSPWNLSATYTYTDGTENRAFGEYFSFDFPTLEDYTIKTSSGLRKHRLVVAGAVDLPTETTLSGKFVYSSPRFLNSFVRTPGGTPPVEVVTVETAGNGDRWGFRQLDLAITQNIPLSFLSDRSRIYVRADIINAMNDRNYNSFNSVTGERNLNSFSTDGPPRTLKLSAGFEF
ncbi:TonB-dependent receptor [Citromicrobium bathyomarinum]|uniref:TonB-dependent receptor n=1 Tax=Citromicrobium bathyomarinum TaxID=72174 RepID=UPI00315A66CD